MSEQLKIPDEWRTTPPSLGDVVDWIETVYQPWLAGYLRQVDPRSWIRDRVRATNGWRVAKQPTAPLPQLLSDANSIRYPAPGSALGELGSAGLDLSEDIIHSQWQRIADGASPFPATVGDARDPYVEGLGAPYYVAPWNIDVWTQFAAIHPYSDRKRYTGRLKEALRDRDKTLGLEWADAGGFGDKIKALVTRDWLPIFDALPAMAEFAVSGGSDIGALAGGMGDVMTGRQGRINQDVASALGRDLGTATSDDEDDDELTQAQKFVQWWRQATPQRRWAVYAIIYRARNGTWPTTAPASIYA